MMRIGDNVPEEVKYKQLFQVVHCTKSDHRILKRDPDECIFVSETARASFTDKKEKVIYNLSNPDNPKKSLILMSTSRIGANDKGDQDRWMISFAELLNRQHVPFLWFYFSTTPLHGAPGNLIRLDPVDDVRGFLKHADYLVHLSENEAYCYSITEALSVGVPVIAFDIPILHELGFQDEIDGYIIPKDLSIDTNIILNAPGFKGYQITDDDKAIVEWRKVLGNTTPRNDYIPERMITVKAIKTYKDIELNRTITPGEEFSVWNDRAEYLYKLRLVEMEG
jgi:glycosyltransferase involved in cell wall biosynthesis